MRLIFYLILLIIANASKSAQIQRKEIREADVNRIRSNETYEDVIIATAQNVGDEASATDNNIFIDKSTDLSDVKNNSDSKPLSNHTSHADENPQLSESNNVVEDISPIQTPGIDYQPNNFPYTNVPWNLLQHFRPSNIVGSLSHKINKFASLLNYPYSPNDGIINYLNPSYLFKKISDKSQQLLSNANSAIFGFGQFGGQDYPFPYRSSLFYNST